MEDASSHAFEVSDQLSEDCYREVERVEEISDPMLAEVFRYWHSLAAGRAMPLAREVDPLGLPRRALGYIFLVDVEHREAGRLRFRVRLAGTHAVEQAGFDPTGRYGEEVPGSEPVAARMANAVASGRPYVADVPLTWSSRNYKRYVTLVCPLADEDVAPGAASKVTRLLAVIHFQ
ncbi:PAS domain-containing protein [Algihabitans albus]|uniref:PAS domain-containing protein n=1 Tax=Algihabitans albus TaxID=2164067 RepID=UPI000E5CBB6B|nr:PAS domain-containing protein [Algihabitans albus]